MTEKQASSEIAQSREDGVCFVHGGYFGARCQKCWPADDPRLLTKYRSNPDSGKK